MKICLICGTSLGFKKFKCQDGFLCKTCYQVASRNFTETVTKKGESEIRTLFAEKDTQQPAQKFVITKRIQQIILFDDQHKQLCLPNHQSYTKQRRGPDYIAYAAIQNCQIEEKIIETQSKKATQKLGTLKVSIDFEKNTHLTSQEIWLIKKPISVTCSTYKTMQSLAEKIVLEVNVTKVTCMSMQD